MSLVAHLLRLVAVLALALAAAAQTLSSYHGVSSTTHQANFDSLAGQGYRMISLAVSGDASNPRYSAVWQQVSGPGWVARHDMTLTQYNSQATSWGNAGFRAKLVAASGAGSNAVFAAVWVADGVAAAHSTTVINFEDHCVWHRQNGRRVVSCAGYTSGDGIDRYVTVAEPDTSGYGWGGRGRDSLADFSGGVGEFALGHAHPIHLSMDSSKRYTSVWRDDRVGGWLVVADRTSAQLASDKSTYQGQGYHLTSIASNGTGGATRYAGIFQQSLNSSPRFTSKSGQVVAALAAFDTYVEGLMSSTGTRNASLAIARQGKLVYARGFTRTESGSFVTQPNTPFRIGSISKPLTGMLVHDLHSRGVGGFGMNSQLVQYLNISQHHAAATGATMARALRHTSGMINFDTEDLVHAWWLAWIGASSVSMPMDELIITRYACNQPFSQTELFRYSNSGFTALGQVVERATSQTWLNALRGRLFEPAGATLLHQQRARPTDHAPGEPPYFLTDVGLEPSNLHDDFRLYTKQYAREYWDSAGGAVTSTVNLARVISAAYCIGDISPTLLPSARTASLERRTYNRFGESGTVNVTDGGWFWSDLGGGRFLYSHVGAVDGFGATCAFTSDGLCFVLATNKTDVAGDWNQLRILADQVSNWPTHDLFTNFGMAPLPDPNTTGTPFCTGNGPISPCGCNNHGVSGHGCRHSGSATGSRLQATGTASVSNDNVVLQAVSSSPSRSGVFFQGTARVNFGIGVTFGDGIKCVGGAIRRLQVRTADSNGFTQTTVPIGQLGGAIAGQTLHYQWWFRDGSASPCGQQANLSNGLSLTWSL